MTIMRTKSPQVNARIVSETLENEKLIKELKERENKAAELNKLLDSLQDEYTEVEDVHRRYHEYLEEYENNLNTLLQSNEALRKKIMDLDAKIGDLSLLPRE